MRLSIIAALSTNNVIGRANGIPWRQSTDLKRLKAMTMGHHMVMGRKTWDSLGKPLPGRVMVVITRRDDFAPEGAIVVKSLEDAIRVVEESGDEEPFIAGGAEIFQQLMHRVSRREPPRPGRRPRPARVPGDRNRARATARKR